MKNHFTSNGGSITDKQIDQIIILLETYKPANILEYMVLVYLHKYFKNIVKKIKQN